MKKKKSKVKKSRSKSKRKNALKAPNVVNFVKDVEVGTKSLADVARERLCFVLSSDRR